MLVVVAGHDDHSAVSAALAERLPGIQVDGCHPAMLDDHVGETSGAVAVVGVGPAGPDAFRAAANHDRVVAFVLLGAGLEADATELISEWPELAVLGVADADDRLALRGAVDGYLASDNPASDLLVGPVDAAALDWTASWLSDRMQSAARVDEVVLTSADGWELHGTRWVPERNHPIPGVILLHTGRSDRAVYARLERLLADAGLAVLNVDWRGRGESTNRGRYFDLSPEVKAAGWRDALAAVEHLANHPAVDGDRIGAVGAVHGGEYAVRAACRDPRLKAIAILTGYRPIEPEEEPHMLSGAVDTMYVTCTDHRITTAAMRALHLSAPPGRSRYVEYPGAPIGYQLFELDHDLEPRIVSWLSEVLSG